MEEPFLTRPGATSLALLNTKGLDVSQFQNVCIQKYIEWSGARISAIVDCFQKIEPPPDLVLFPEGSIPLPCLSVLATWSAETGSVVLAGTHTPRLGRAVSRYYNDLNLSKSDMNRLKKQTSRNVLPLMRAGKTVLIPKKLHSIFEQSEVSPSDPILPSFRTYDIVKEGARIKLLPLICSEALRLHNVVEPYDIATIIAYDHKPEHFRGYITQQVLNQTVVALCNDGRFGGSFVFTAEDTRRGEWFYQALPSGLPKGDSILIVDVDLQATAVQVGTATPHPPLKLIRLASITHENSLHFEVSKDLERIREMDEPGLRAHELQQLLKQTRASSLQQTRLEHLHSIESRGLSSSEWWDALGPDCLVHGQPSLRDLERRLATTCHEGINDILKSPSRVKPEVAAPLVDFLSVCLKRAGGQQHKSFFLSPEAGASVINRDLEVKRVLDAIDHANTIVLETSGLPQIGKSSIIQKALAQSGITSIIHVRLTNTSSVDYILYSIIKQGGGELSPPYDDPLTVATSSPVVKALQTARILYIEAAHYLLDHGVWRDALAPKVLVALVETAANSGTTILFESQWGFKLDIPDPSARVYLRVSGLENKQLEHGVSLFDAQLRRNELSTRSVTDEDKKFIVAKLGGHPIAIALAADVVAEEGSVSLLETLRQRKGFFLNYVSKLIRGLNLSEEERQILQLVRLARGPVPREAVLAAVDYTSGLTVRNLISCGALELDRLGLIQLPGILEGYFDPKNLSSDQRKAFHENAALSFQAVAEMDQNNVWAVVEAEYHAGVAGIEISVSSKVIDGALAAAKEFYRQQRYEEARPIVKALLKRRPTHDLLRFAALVDARTNNLDDALKLAGQIFSQYPRDTWILSELTQIAMTQYQADEIAEELIGIARSAGVEDVRLLINEGRLLQRQRRWPDAKNAFQRAAQLTFHDPWPFFYLGQLLCKTGRLDEAIDVLYEGETFCYEKNSQSRGAYNAIRTQLGLAYLFNNQIDLAAPILDSLIEEEPMRTEVIRAHAALTIKRDGIDKTHVAFEKLAKADTKTASDRCQFHLLLGQYHDGTGNLQMAIKEFEKAHQADISNVFVMMNLAKIQFELGKSLWLDQSDAYRFYLDSCAKTVRKILDFDPDNQEGIRLMEGLHQFDISV